MIAPEFRQSISFNLKKSAQKYVEQNHGTDLWNTLQPVLDEIDAAKAELQHAAGFKSDVEQLKKFQDLFAKNYQHAVLLNKYFSFGTGGLQIPMKFAWADSFSGQRIESHSPYFEMISSKYNFAVCLARRAAYMNLEDDGIKHACKYMQQAGWIFDDLRQNVTQLKPGEVTPDFTAEALGMLAALMLAQAQYLFYKMASEKKMKPEILSKIALQISVYFREAYALSQANRVLKAFQRGQFAGVMLYHDKYFEASAWQVLGVHRFTQAKEDAKDMGHAAGTAAHAAALFASAGPIIKQIPADYAANYQKKKDQADALAKMSAEKAKTVFFEKVTPAKEVKMPDAKNYVKYDAGCKEELETVSPHEDVFRHIIPPQVRNLQSEFKTVVQNLLDQKYKEQEAKDVEQRAFFGQYGLPQSFFDLTQTDDIPEQYWTKIEQFQKKGAIANFENSINGMQGMSQQCEMMIQTSEVKINKEQEEDANLRTVYSNQWPLPTSAALNGPYKNNISMYRSKLQIAATQDQATNQRFLQQRGDLAILTKSKQELMSEIPSSAAVADVSQMPAAVAVKQALDNIEQAKAKRDGALKEAVENLANLNMIDQLLQVHQGGLQKDAVFKEKREVYDEYFKRITEQNALIESSNQAISATWSDFEKLKQSVKIDPTRQAFFQQIDLALMCQEDLENMLHQGNEFYQRLIEHLSTLTVNVSDFKMGRNLQMAEQCRALGAEPPKFDDDGAGGGPGAGGPGTGAPPQAPPVNYEFEIFDPTTLPK